MNTSISVICNIDGSFMYTDFDCNNYSHIHQAYKRNKAALEESYLVIVNIAKAEKPHSIGKELIKLCLKDVGLSLLDEEATEKLDSVPNHTVDKRIQHTVCQKTLNKL